VKASLLFRIASDPIGRVWSGLGDIIIPSDIVEAEPALYLGGGELVNLPDIDQVINGVAARVDVTVSGVSAATLALALEDAPSVRGADVHVGIVYFDSNWQTDEVEWVAKLGAGPLTVASQTGNDGSRTRSITLTIGSDFLDRCKAPVAFFTDSDQRRRSPTDSIFDHVAGLNAGTARSYGPR
jgi:hypothetical protein